MAIHADSSKQVQICYILAATGRIRTIETMLLVPLGEQWQVPEDALHCSSLRTDTMPSCTEQARSRSAVEGQHRESGQF